MEKKQVYQVTTGWTDAFVSTRETHTVYPSNAKPVTENKSAKEIYRMAVARMLAPGQFKIADNQYLDEKYLKAEAAVKYYYSNLATSTNSPRNAGTYCRYT